MRWSTWCSILALGLRVLCAQNPIIPGFNPDPSPIRLGTWYYLATSSFEYWPGIPIYRSQDLVNWELFSHALTNPQQLSLYGTPTGAGAWTPTLSEKNGIVYLALMQRWTYDPVARVWPRVFWLTSRNLRDWSLPVWAEPWGIDPGLYHDPVSGKDYLNLMAPNNNHDRIWGISQCEVDLASGSCIGPYRSLWNGTLPSNATARPEGPKMFFRNGFHYLLIAEGGTDLLHRATIARSRSPIGPWEPAPNNPILYNGNHTYGNLTVQSTGHGTLIETPNGDWFMVYLARRNVNGASPLGRETLISKVQWRHGWPVVNGGNPVLLSEAVDGLPAERTRELVQQHSFDLDLAASGWYTLRTPYVPVLGTSSRSLYVEPRKHGIVLHPNVFDLSDRDVPAAVLRKQTSLNMTFSAATFPIPSSLPPGGKIGISAYLSELVHHDIGVAGCRNSSGLCVYTSLGRNGTEQYAEESLHPGFNRSVELVIRAEPLKYCLGYKSHGQDRGAVHWVTTFESRWMAWAPSGWFVFEGAMFALFASGSGKPWTSKGPTVGFSSADEYFFQEDLPDFDKPELLSSGSC